MYTLFMLLQATTEWLKLNPHEREQFVVNELQPIFAHHPKVQLTFYDAEAFSSRCSDLALFTTTALDEYTALIDALRNTKLYTQPYFAVVDIIPAKLTNFV